MTTIAFRDGVLASDTAVFDRGVYCGEVAKIFRAPDGSIGGSCGCFGDMCAFRDWFIAGAKDAPPLFRDDDSEAVIIHSGQTIEWVGEKQKRVTIAASMVAIGSGFKIALGAMHAGADAVRALEIAAALDCTTRLPLTVLEIA